MTNGELLRYIRKQHGVKMAPMARDLKIGVTSISNFETNVSDPPINRVIMFYDYLGYKLIPVHKKSIE